jgi:predicted ATPase
MDSYSHDRSFAFVDGKAVGTLIEEPHGKPIEQHHLKLFGRQKEFGVLEEVYSRNFCKCNGGSDYTVQASTQQSKSPSRNKQELVLVYGHAGAGKTSLVLELRSQIPQDQLGIFLSGKFELGSNQDPYAVFLAVCSQLAESLADGGKQKGKLEAIRTAVQKSVGQDGISSLVRMIPGLDQLLCVASDGAPIASSCELPAADALRRFQSKFCRFLHAVSTIVPLVLFVDDLQWADKASLELLQALLLPLASPSSLLIIGAYRHDEVLDDNDPEGFSKHISTTSLLQKPPLYFFLRDAIYRSSSLSASMNITKIHLLNLDESSTNELVAEKLKLSNEEALPLSRLVHAESKGNPFDAVQTVLSLSEQGMIYRDSKSGAWTWDKISAAKGPHAESPQERVCRKMDSLSQTAREVIHAAALMGDEVDETSLVMVMEGITTFDIGSTLEKARNEGLVVHASDRGCYRFQHDSIRQTILSTINNRNALSFKIGHTLWKRLPPLYFDAKIFTIASLMKTGISTITDQNERYKLAALYLEAGLKASSHFDFPDASLYLETGIECLEGNNYWSDHYELTLDLFNAAADSAVCNQSFCRVSTLVAEVKEHARTFKDKLPAYVAQIYSLGQFGGVKEATKVGMEVLQQLGEPLPRRVTKLTLISELIKTKVAFWKLPKDSLLTLPPMKGEDKIAAMNIMSILLPYVYQAASEYTLLLSTRLARLCIHHGLHKAGALGLLIYGSVLCRADRKEGYRVGKLAVSVAQHTLARELLPRLEVNFYTFVHHWRCPLRESLPPLVVAGQAGLAIGEIEYAMFALRSQCVHSLFCGLKLNTVEQMTVSATEQMSLFKQDSLHRLTMPVVQFIRNLQGQVFDAHELFNGGHVGETESLQLTCLTLGIHLSFLWRDHDAVEQLSDRRKKLKLEGFALYSFTVCRLAEALTAVARIRNGINTKKNVRITMAVLKQMKEWARDAPANFLHKLLLLEAEMKSLKPHKADKSNLKALYVKAIEGALRENFTHEAAMASELLGDYLNRSDDRPQANVYWNKARSLYLEWGAKEKACRLSTLHGLINNDV